MKTKLLLSALLSFYFCLLSSQVPQGFNYQAIARDGSGNPIANATIKVMLSILSDTTGFYVSGSGTYIWEEEQTNIKTNAFGLFTVVLGNPLASKIQGTALNFSAVDWAKTPLYIGTKIANPTTYKIMGSTKLWSVPYSMVSSGLSGTLKKLGVTGVTTSPDSALFEVKNRNGQTVFAVYNEGVRVYVDDGVAKSSTKGGFAIGGFSTLKSPGQEFFRVTRDSTRIYLNNALGKSTKGGFAIGGFDVVKGVNQNLLTVSDDSVRVYIDTNTGKGAPKGGFAIGGFDQVKAQSQEYLRVTRDSTRIITADTLKGFGVSNLSAGNALGYLRLTPSNYFIGHQAGLKLTIGKYNSVIGYKAARNITSGNSNTILGCWADSSLTTGSNNTVIGQLAGYNLTTGNNNILIGNWSGWSHTNQEYNVLIGQASGINLNSSGLTGSYNTFLGNATGLQIRNCMQNVFLGTDAGMWLDNGQGNTFIGADAGRSRDWSSDNYPYRGSVNAVYNTFIGNQAGFYITNGNNNLALGFQAGYNNANGSGNVFIGNQAGYSETGSNKLYISNSSSVPPLIYGNFSTGTVAIGTTTPTTSYKLYVNGNAYATGTWSSSDIRWKMNIIPLANVLCKLLSLKGVNFEWRKTEFPEINFDSGNQIGLIAQDVEKIFPELVKTDDNGYKAVSYEKLSVILVEGMKEQQKQIDSYKSEIQSLHEEVSQIESQQKEIDELKTLVNSLVANQNVQGNK